MRRRPALALAAVCALAVGASACDTTEPYAAKVNGSTISLEELEDELRAIVAINPDGLTGALGEAGDTDTSVSGEFARNYLNQRIVVLLVAQEAEHRGIDPSTADSADVDGLLEGLPDEVKAKLHDQAALYVAMANSLATDDDPVDPAVVDAGVELLQLRCIAHILVGTEAEAQDVLDRLDDGEDFADLAAEVSLDTGSGAQGGALDPTRCVSFDETAQYVPEFGEAALAATFGEPTAPVKSDFGYHVILVTEPTDEVLAARASEIQSQLAQATATAGQNAFSELQRTQLTEAEVSISPRIGRWEPGQGIVATGSAPADTVPAETAPES